MQAGISAIMDHEMDASERDAVIEKA